MAHILVVEDEEKLSNLLKDYLIASGFEVSCILRGDEVEPWLAKHHADAMILDVMLPGKDGMAICRDIRQHSDIPILMVTARVEEIDRLLGLELGADDYICKPFSPREVVARVKTVLRRIGPKEQAPAELLDIQRMTLTCDDQQIVLTAVECQLLKPMVAEPGRIFSRQQLMDSMYQDNRVVSDRTIDSHIKKLRKKLNDANVLAVEIQSVYGAGYCAHIART
ncbi:response regulator [Thalassotalea euphylliae]|uniref:response regulator n=1 Tax=Thalassotalea euphylliae TaxID=1655234 RepID=UPI00362600A8